MLPHLNGVTNTAVLVLPATVILAFGTEELRVGEPVDGQHNIDVKPKWEQVISMGHVQAKVFMQALIGMIKQLEEANGEIKVPQQAPPGSVARN